MKRAFSTLGCHDWELAAVLDLAHREGVALEVRGLGGDLDVPAYLARTCGAPEDFATVCSETGVTVVSLDTSFRLMKPSAEDREALLRYVPWAEALGGVRLRVFDGGTSLSDDELAVAAQELEWWNTQRRQAGWQTDLMIETHDALVTTEKIERFASAVPAGAALLWDAHHTWRKGGEDPVATWEAINPLVVHMHVKDSVDQPSERHPFTYVRPGEGKFPMAALRDRLRQDGYDGPLSLEWERAWHPYLPPVDQALQAAAKNKWW
jgi:sugar phosphate isomerase/epimerase